MSRPVAEPARSAIANINPLHAAEQHRSMAEPVSARS